MARYWSAPEQKTPANRNSEQINSLEEGQLTMNLRHFHSILAAIIVLPISSEVSAADIGTAFTYQGFLEKPAGTPVGKKAPEACDFEFALWDDAAPSSQGIQIGPTLSFTGLDAVEVVDGAFTVMLDFGASAINGDPRWLAISVCCPSSCTPVALYPRVELTPAPYSIRAGQGVGGPNALNVTPAGDVGIGTPSPVAKLDVNGAARTTTMEITGGAPLVPSAVGWGENLYGEADPPFDTVTIAAGEGFSLAIRSDGTLVGWGRNGNGEISVPSGTFTAVAASANFSLAIRTDGTLVGWGSNPLGVLDVPSGTFTAVAAGGSHCIALRSNGTLVGWGNNSYGQTDVPAGIFTAVTAGNSYSIAIRSDGTLVGWGVNVNGQTNVPSGTFVAVSAKNGHSVAIRMNGTLVGWGENSSGQIDVPSGTFVAIAAGSSHSLAIRDDWTLVGWGHNGQGQIDVPAGTFASVFAGQSHSLAIQSNPAAANPALRLLADSAAKPGSNTWTIWSDRRLKKNIEPLSGALERILQLHGVTFQWSDPASQGGITGTQMGLIADEVQRAFPQWVGRDPKGYQTLTVGGFEALTAEALRELRAEKDREIAELKVEIEKLKEALDRRP